MPSQRITIRLSPVLAARLAVKAGPHGNVAALIREAIEASLAEEPDTRQPGQPRAPGAAASATSPVAATAAERADTLAPAMAAIQARLEVFEQRLQALEAITAPGRLAATTPCQRQPARPPAPRGIPQQTPEETPPPDVCPPFDATTHTLGRLCPRGHEWGRTGQSLLRCSNHRCRQCDNDQKRERRAAQRQVPPS